MQEDKSSKWLADQLRKRQEEDLLPYELGAWEAFESKRASLVRRKLPYWISGIAATVTLLLVAGGFWLAQLDQSENPQPSEQMALDENHTPAPIHSPAPVDTASGISGYNATDESHSSHAYESDGNASGLKSKSSDRDQLKTGDLAASSGVDPAEARMAEQYEPRPVNPSSSQTVFGSPEVTPKEIIAIVEKPSNEKKLEGSVVEKALIATNEKRDVEKAEPPVNHKAEIAAGELPVEPQLTEAEIEDILSTKSFASIAMGVSPGFGSSQSSEQATAGTSLGLGVMVDMSITGKLVMGSGVAVNYMNQASESQSYNYAGINAASSTVVETDEVSQVQVDIPLYFKYPITRDQKISVQAGFSNLITFNQGAEQESSYTRQVAVYDALAASSFKLQSESISQTQALNVPNQKFYPFATANLGVNIRLFESKKTRYEVMPFYNYPLQEFSGYGEKLGIFGASFKVNFGAIQGK